MPTVISKPAKKSKTMWFNGVLTVVGALAAVAPDVLAAVPGFANTDIGRGLGAVFMVIGAVNVALRRNNTQPVTLRGGEVVTVDHAEFT